MFCRLSMSSLFLLDTFELCQLTKRPYRVQLDLSLRTPGVAYASAIDTCVTFEGEDHLVVCTSDGVINQFTNVSFVQCEGAEGDVGMLQKQP